MIAAVVLAAGASRRFGSHKLLLDLHGQPLVRRSVEAVLAARLDDVVVVLGREADAVRDALAGLPLRFVVNPRYPEGMSTSLHAGVAALLPGIEAALIALADQPLPTSSVLPALIETFRASGKPIVVPVYAGTRGNPVLFAASMFEELSAVHGDQGAREVVARLPERVTSVHFPFPPPRDVDDPDAYGRLLAAWQPDEYQPLSVTEP